MFCKRIIIIIMIKTVDGKPNKKQNIKLEM